MGAVANISERQYSAAQLRLIRDMFCKGATDDQFNVFMACCQRYQLDPFRREIYGIIRQVRDAEASDKAGTKVTKPELTIVVGIDGFRKRSDETGTYMPDGLPPRFIYDPDAVNKDVNPKGIVSCEVTLQKYHEKSGAWMPVTSKVDWDEYAPIRERTNWDNANKRAVGTGEFYLTSDMWKKMPGNMLSKVAEAKAHRMGWPSVHSGYYESAEMDQALAADVIEDSDKERRVAATGGKDAITLLFHAGQPVDIVPLGQVHDRIMEWARERESPTEIEVFMRNNRPSLQQFWARDKGAALDLKQELEARAEALTAIGNGDNTQG